MTTIVGYSLGDTLYTRTFFLGDRAIRTPAARSVLFKFLPQKDLPMGELEQLSHPDPLTQALDFGGTSIDREKSQKMHDAGTANGFEQVFFDLKQPINEYPFLNLFLSLYLARKRVTICQ